MLAASKAPDETQPMPDYALGLPSELVRRRPDIRAAEARGIAVAPLSWATTGPSGPLTPEAFERMAALLELVEAAARRGLTGRKAEVVLDGGSLFIEWLSRTGD